MNNFFKKSFIYFLFIIFTLTSFNFAQTAQAPYGSQGDAGSEDIIIVKGYPILREAYEKNKEFFDSYIEALLAGEDLEELEEEGSTIPGLKFETGRISLEVTEPIKFENLIIEQGSMVINTFEKSCLIMGRIYWNSMPISVMISVFEGPDIRIPLPKKGGSSQPVTTNIPTNSPNNPKPVTQGSENKEIGEQQKENQPKEGSEKEKQVEGQSKTEVAQKPEPLLEQSKLPFFVPTIHGGNYEIGRLPGGWKIIISGALDLQTLKPFATTNIPGIKDVAFNDIRVHFDFSKSQGITIALGGTATVLGVKTRAMLGFMYSPQIGIFFPVMHAILPEGWSLGQSLPMLKDSVVDLIRFKKVIFVLTPVGYPDPSVGENLRGGINIIAELSLGGPIEYINHFLGDPFSSIKISGTIGYVPKDLTAGVKLPFKIPFKSSIIKSGLVVLKISGAPSVGIQTQLDVNPTGKKEDELNFLTVIGVEKSPLGLTMNLEGAMVGIWKNVFGITGFDIGQLGIATKILPEGIPAALGITGMLKMGSKRIILGINVSDKPTEALLIGQLQGEISLKDIIALPIEAGAKAVNFFKKNPDKLKEEAKKMGMENVKDENTVLDRFASRYPIVGKAIPDISIKDIFVSIAPAMVKLDKGKVAFEMPRFRPEASDTDPEGIYDQIIRNSIGGFNLYRLIVSTPMVEAAGEMLLLVRPGVTVKGTINILKKHAMIDFNLSSQGLWARGALSEIIFGPLKITGPGLAEQEKGSPLEKGPVLDFEISANRVGFLMRGYISLFGIKSLSDINIDSSGIKFLLTGSLFGLFEASIYVQSQGELEDPDLVFRTKFTDNTYKLISETSVDFANSIIESARKSSDSLQIKIDNIDAEIKEKEDEIKRLNAGIQKTTEVLKEVQVSFNEPADENLKDILDLAQESYDQYISKYSKYASLDDSAMIDLPLELAWNPFDKKDRAVARLKLEIAGLKTKKTTLIATQKLAKGGAKATAEIIKFGGKVGGMMVPGVTTFFLPPGVIKINSMDFSGSLNEISSGKLPEMIMKVAVLGFEHTATFQFDVNHPADSFKNISKGLAKLLIGI